MTLHLWGGTGLARIKGRVFLLLVNTASGVLAATKRKHFLLCLLHSDTSEKNCHVPESLGRHWSLPVCAWELVVTL